MLRLWVINLFNEGVDYYSKEIQSNKTSVVFMIWDTCGNEMEYKILPSNVYKQASAYLIVCSYDNRESFEMIKSWISHVQNYMNYNQRNVNLNSHHMIPIIILINKVDIKQNRLFKITDVNKLIDEFSLNIVVYEVSAKENIRIDYVFEKIANMFTGKSQLNNEGSLNTTGYIDDENLRSSMIDNRKKSFKLKDMDSKYDKDKNKNGSCCSKN